MAEGVEDNLSTVDFLVVYSSTLVALIVIPAKAGIHENGLDSVSSTE